uniref:Uncharacterized protein n=1 Tax=Chenopodium quinoa TaxID=63459 RepID=A0A803N4M1_CHEQI
MEEIAKLLEAGFIQPTKYVEWIANIDLVIKMNGKIRICIPKDQYPMLVADMLINALSRHEFVSTLDGFTRYHQIRIAKDDRSKTTFRFPVSLGLYEYMAMPFELKNAGALVDFLADHPPMENVMV